MKISVGLPFFNAEATLGAAISSVLNQSFGDFELLLLDDGSTDGSFAVAKASLGDPRVRLFSDGRNRGLPARLNELAERARNPVIARMDADDVMHPERLALQRRYLVDSGADVVGSSAYVVDEGLRVKGVRYARTFKSRADVLLHGGFIHPSCLGWRSWFRSNPYDDHFPRAEDLELWARTVERSRFSTMDTPLLFYREPRRPNLKAFRASWRTARKILRQYGKGSLSGSQLLARTLRTYAADALYRLAELFPAASEALLGRRNSPMPPEGTAAAEALLARALRPVSFLPLPPR